MERQTAATGIAAVAAPVPMFVLSAIIALIGMSLLNGDAPRWLPAVSMLPMIIPILLGLLGVIHSFIRIRQKRAWLGLLLTVLGIAVAVFLIYGAAWLASRY